jgi:hypothetical protein
MAAAGTLAGLVAWPAQGRARTARWPVAALTGGSTADASFLKGIGPGHDAISLDQDWQGLESQLDRLAGYRLVGLLDPGRHTVVEAMLQARNARLLSLGSHQDGRHRISTAPAAHGVGAALAHGLARAGFEHQVAEAGLGPVAGSFTGVADLAAGDWAGLMGEALGRIAAGNWVPGEPRQLRRAGRPNSHSNDSLVSFVVQL